jgi:hypothetical protein
MGVTTEKKSLGNDGEVESQPQASHLPLEIATAIPTFPPLQQQRAPLPYVDFG